MHQTNLGKEDDADAVKQSLHIIPAWHWSVVFYRFAYQSVETDFLLQVIKSGLKGFHRFDGLRFLVFHHFKDFIRVCLHVFFVGEEALDLV